MDAATWVAVAAAAVGVVALWFNWRAVRAAEQQTHLQRQLRIDAAQPYVWADVRADNAIGTLLNFTIGNSGSSIASNVRVTIEPPLPSIPDLSARLNGAVARLNRGLPSLTPGQALSWPLGQGFNLIRADEAQEHTIHIEADGPFGSMEPISYVVSLSDYAGVLDRPAGSLDELTKAVREIGTRISS